VRLQNHTMETATAAGKGLALVLLIAISNIGRDKSFVDDLIYERGIVSSRVALLLRSAEIKPLFFDLFLTEHFPHTPLLQASLVGLYESLLYSLFCFVGRAMEQIFAPCSLSFLLH
jgi:hypothetical protein